MNPILWYLSLPWHINSMLLINFFFVEKIREYKDIGVLSNATCVFLCLISLMISQIIKTYKWVWHSLRECLLLYHIYWLIINLINPYLYPKYSSQMTRILWHCSFLTIILNRPIIYAFNKLQHFQDCFHVTINIRGKL